LQVEIQWQGGKKQHDCLPKYKGDGRGGDHVIWGLPVTEQIQKRAKKRLKNSGYEWQLWKLCQQRLFGQKNLDAKEPTVRPSGVGGTVRTLCTKPVSELGCWYHTMPSHSPNRRKKAVPYARGSVKVVMKSQKLKKKVEQTLEQDAGGGGWRGWGGKGNRETS